MDGICLFGIGDNEFRKRKIGARESEDARGVERQEDGEEEEGGREGHKKET